MTDTARPLMPLEESAPRAHSGPVEQPPDPSPARPAPPRRRVRRLTAFALAVAAVLVGAGAAYLYSVAQPKVYGAEAEFLLTPRPDMSDAAVDRAMVTDVMLVTSPAVLQPVAARTGVPIGELSSKVSAEIVGRSNILRITVADADRARALTIVEQIVQAYPRALPTAQGDQPAPVQSTLLTPAQALDEPLEPQPRRALATGALLGLLVAGAVLVVLWRPWRLIRPAPYWT